MKTYITEGVGTFFLALALYAIVSMWTDSLGLYILMALTLVVLVYSGFQVSHADYNPIVSLARWVTGDYTVSQLWKYLVAQCIGSMVWVVIMATVTDTTILPYGQDIWGGMLFVILVVCAVFFSYIVLHSTKTAQQHHGGFFSIIIGIGFFLTLLFGTTYTWSIFNPALELSSAVTSIIRHGVTVQVDQWEKITSYQWKTYTKKELSNSTSSFSDSYQSNNTSLWLSKKITFRHFWIYLLAPLVWGVWWWILFLLVQGRPLPLHLSVVFDDESTI